MQENTWKNIFKLFCILFLVFGTMISLYVHQNSKINRHREQRRHSDEKLDKRIDRLEGYSWE